jgi:hypothetical protein
MEGYTGPGHNNDGTWLPSAKVQSGAEETASIDHGPAVAGYPQAAEDAARAARQALKRVLTEKMICRLLLRPSKPLSELQARRDARDALDAAVVFVTNPQVVTDEFREQLITQIASNLKDWWKKARPVDAPAPVRDQAENAVALRLRVLVRQHSRRGPPREESDDEDPAIGGLRRVFDLCRRPGITVRRQLGEDRAARRRS